MIATRYVLVVSCALMRIHDPVLKSGHEEYTKFMEERVGA
jgi:hypothetical protein